MLSYKVPIWTIATYVKLILAEQTYILHDYTKLTCEGLSYKELIYIRRAYPKLSCVIPIFVMPT